MAINAPNDGRFWNTLSSDGGDPVSYILELVDNSIDAGARNIDIRYSTGKNGFLSIEDDGSGMSEDQVRGLCVLGHSDKDSGSGRYGTGFKSAFSNIGKVVNVTTSNGEAFTKLEWDIDVDIETRVWGEGGNINSVERQQVPFTRVNVVRTRSRKALAKNVEKELSKHLTPALKGGVKVTYNGNELSPFKLYWDESEKPCEGEARSPKGHLLRYKIGKADLDSMTKADCGWYVYKNSRAVADYTGIGKGLSDSEKTLVWIELVQEDHSSNEWQLDAFSKSRLSDVGDWNWLTNFVKEKALAYVKSEVDEKETFLVEGLIGSLVESFNDSFKRSKDGDHGLDEDPSGDEMLDVPVNSKGGGKGAPGGAGSESGYRVNDEGDTHKFSKTIKRGGLNVEMKSLDDLTWDYVHDVDKCTLVIYIEKSLLVHAKGSGVHALRSITADAMLDWEDKKGESICPKSVPLSLSRASRHRALVRALGGK